MVLMMLVFSSCGKDDRLTIGSVIFEGTNEWFVEAITGMNDAAKEMDVNLSLADSRYDVQVEKELILEQVKKKANAIVLCPLAMEESGAALSEASRLGIPVITWNSLVTPRPTSQIVVDSGILGSATGEYVTKYIQDRKIEHLNAAFIIDTSFSIGVERCNGFRQSVQPLIDSGIMTVTAETKGNLHEQTSVTVEKLLREHPEINFIWCWNQMSTEATVSVLKKLGRSDIIVTGTDMSLALAQEMQNDAVNLIAITTQQPYKMGYEAVKTAIKAAKGETVENNIVIPTLTLTKEDPQALEKYIQTHKQFEKQSKQ